MKQRQSKQLTFSIAASAAAMALFAFSTGVPGNHGDRAGLALFASPTIGLWR